MTCETQKLSTFFVHKNLNWILHFQNQKTNINLHRAFMKLTVKERITFEKNVSPEIKKIKQKIY